MSLFNLFKANVASPVISSTYEQQPDKVGRLVTAELEAAITECTAEVTRIAKDCRARNRKFRDTEFDLETDQDRCINGLGSLSVGSTPSDVLRVTQIFDNPQFFVDGASASDLVQGNIGDCWFISALAVVATASGLVEKFCVARDEVVGVYGFIFFRDGKWVNVIIDDMLYTQIPKWDELDSVVQLMYKNEKAKYEAQARKGTKTLFFGKSGTDSETWVPLIEKAYAKLHGSYAVLEGGQTCEGVEDMTGGVTTFISTKDILDTDKFWTEELLKANKDRLFACSFSGSGWTVPSGLYANHAYAVLRAVEVNGKRFVIVRNPWAKCEWTGPWSDGSKEWTTEWLARLPELNYSFDNDGQFVMEYKDWLNSWEQIDRVLLFDSSWTMSAHWLQVQARPLPSAWSFGDVSYTVSIPKTTTAIIVLSQIDTRYYDPISGRYLWTFDMKIFKKGSKEVFAESIMSHPGGRSVNLELQLEAGEYVIHVRLDRPYVVREKGYYETGLETWNQRTLSRVLTEKAKAQSNAANFKAETQANNLPIPLDILGGQNLEELEKKALVLAEEKKKLDEAAGITKLDEKKDGTTVVKTVTTTVETVTTVVKAALKADEPDAETPTLETAMDAEPAKTEEEKAAEEKAKEEAKKEHPEDDSILLGLRLYCKSDAAAVIAGQLRHEMEVSAKLAL
ncbi:cysteine proteinase [Mycena floridula]|nr:cysteine proteinase [Mycena floridula]